jgi:tetratricopeptide (TPR) repeat protein
VALFALAIFAVALLGAAGSLQNELIYDDIPRIVENQDLAQPGALLDHLIFRYEGEVHSPNHNDPSRPLVFLIYGLLRRAGEGSPLPFHLASALIHALVAVLTFLLARRILRSLTGQDSLTAPTLAALFFALSPINMGTVIYAYGLSDVLSTFCILLYLYCLFRKPRPAPLDLALSSLSLALGLLSKQSAAVAPLFAVAFDLFFISNLASSALRRRLRYHVPGFALVALYIAVRYAYFGQLGDFEAARTYPAATYLFAQPIVILRYLQLTLVPYGLSLDHWMSPHFYSVATKALVSTVFVALAYGLFRLLRRPTPARRLVLFAALFYFIALAPTSSILPTIDLMVERRVYLANFAIVLLIVLAYMLVSRIALGGAWRRTALGVAALHLAALLAVTLHRNQVFHTQEGAWAEVLSSYPESLRAVHALSDRYINEKRFAEAHEILVRVPAYDQEPFLLYNLGRIALLTGKLDEASDDAAKILRIQPRDVNAHLLAGVALLNLRRLPEAEGHYLRAIELDPARASAHFDLAQVYRFEGQPERAQEQLGIAHNLDPRLPLSPPPPR